MKTKLSEKVEIPEGVDCTYEDKIFTCKKGAVSLSRKINIPKVKLKISGREISFEGDKTNKKQYKVVKSNIAHLSNMFLGLNEKYVYTLEACNVHFPMTMKVEPKRLVINNFLGEKVPRIAALFPNVLVEVKGQRVIVSSNDKEAAGKVVSSIEKATKIRNRDRRIFQDGIFLVEKPGREM